MTHLQYILLKTHFSEYCFGHTSLSNNNIIIYSVGTRLYIAYNSKQKLLNYKPLSIFIEIKNYYKLYYKYIHTFLLTVHVLL